MTNHEQPNDEFFPDFMVRFDGTQPELAESERQDVARDFTVFVNGLFGKYESSVNHRETDHGDRFDTLQFVLRGEDRNWLINCLSTATNSSRSTEYQIPEKGLAITRLDDANNEQEEFQYNFRDGVVRRMDLGAPGGVYLDEEQYEHAKEIAIEAIDDVSKNEDLERSMGYYDQPIGSAELDGLKKLIEGGELTPVPAA